MSERPAAYSGGYGEGAPPERGEHAPRPWRWRNCRSLSFGVEVLVCPWDWRIASGSRCDGGEHVGGAYGKDWWFVFGPLIFLLHADHGDISAEGWRARFGLSEEEAWERSK